MGVCVCACEFEGDRVVSACGAHMEWMRRCTSVIETRNKQETRYKSTGGSAFPAQPIIRHPERGDIVVMQGGMSLRDYFAAKAMQGMMANFNFDKNLLQNIASTAYQLADDMLKERD